MSAREVGGSNPPSELSHVRAEPQLINEESQQSDPTCAPVLWFIADPKSL